MRRIGLAFLTAFFLLALAVPATARKPIIAYTEAGQFKLYDAELQADVAAPPIPVPPPPNDETFRFGISHNGRYVFYLGADGLHLFDRQANGEVSLPGINVLANPGFLTVSNSGLLAFDANANGPSFVYDSNTKQFVNVGFPPEANNDHRQTALSGDGRFLATTCMGDCVDNEDDGSDVYVQSLLSASDTGFPGHRMNDTEDPCISGDGSLVGWHEGAVQKDVLIYNRNTGGFVTPPGMNDPAANETFCTLDGSNNYVGFMRNPFMLFELSSNSFVPLPNKPFSTNNARNKILSAPQCGGQFATHIGSAVADLITGTPANDVILALEGNDTVNGGGGIDLVCGGTGNDRLTAGSNRTGDRLFGQEGNDRITGGPGPDTLGGDQGRDRISGRKGKDRCTGGPGKDKCSGGKGNDKCIGGPGKDKCSGGKGKDKCVGGPGKDKGTSCEKGKIERGKK